MIFILQIMAVITALALLRAFAAMFRSLFHDFPRLLWRLKFSIFDLLFLITVICVSLAIMRVTWETAYFGYAFMVPVFAPLVWLVRFALDDWRSKRERRSHEHAAELPDINELPDRLADSPPPRTRPKWWQRGNQQSGVPHLSPTR